MNERCSVVLLGSLGVAVECLQWLLEQEAFQVRGVVCSRDPLSRWRRMVGDRDMQEAAATWDVPMLDLDELCDLKPDLGLSVRFHQIVRPRHLQSVRHGIINLHGAPLPELRGSMCDAHAILEGHPQFGASLHWMDEGIDTGDILAVERFAVNPDDTVYDLFRRSNALGLEMIKKHLADIVSHKIQGEPQEVVARQIQVTPQSCLKKDIMAHKTIRGHVDPERMWNVARAFAFPGHEPAHVETAHGRVYLTTSWPGGE